MPAPRQPAVVQAYYATRAIRRRLLRLQAAAFDGLWLGLLGPDRLGQLDEAFYHRTREVHAGELVGYEDDRYVRRGLAGWEREVVERQFVPGGRILVTGAGNGREVLALLEARFDAMGYEPNPHLVAIGRRVLEADGHGPRLALMPRSTFPPDAGGGWDAVIVGWGSYMLMPGREVRLRFLSGAATHLAPGGMVLVSAWLRPEGDAYVRWVRWIGTAVRRLRGAPPLELGDGLASNFVHRFTLDELLDEVRRAGLEPVASGSEPYGWVVGRAR